MTSFYLMDEDFDISTINLTFYRKEIGRTRETRESLNDRAYLIRTEQLWHKTHTSSYIIVVLIEKYIDDKKVNAWSWMEEATTEDVLSFPSLTQKEKSRLQDEERKERMKALADLTPEQIKQMKEEEKKARKRLTAKLYYQKHKERMIQKSKAWAQNNKDKVHASHRKYNQKLREQRLWEDQQKDSSL